MFLLIAVVGGAIAAGRLSPTDDGLQLLEGALAAGIALGVLIAMLLPISGAHFNPAVTLAAWRLGHLERAAVAPYIAAQVVGGFVGALIANLMFELDAVSIATTDRISAGTFLGEVVATFGLVAVIFSLVRLNRLSTIPAAVGGYIAAAYWFTSSTSFANPAVTFARMFSDTPSGIAPASAPGFLIAQIGGLVLAVLWVAWLRPVEAD